MRERERGGREREGREEKGEGKERRERERQQKTEGGGRERCERRERKTERGREREISHVPPTLRIYTKLPEPNRSCTRKHSHQSSYCKEVSVIMDKN